MGAPAQHIAGTRSSAGRSAQGDLADAYSGSGISASKGIHLGRGFLGVAVAPCERVPDRGMGAGNTSFWLIGIFSPRQHWNDTMLIPASDITASI